MTFEDFGFDERIQKGIDEAGFKTPMPVQAQCFDLLIKNHRDIYAQSQTGTGKTAAFLLGIFQLLLKDEKYAGQKALIVVPTRELAVQIEAEGKLLGKYLDFNIGSVYGGVGYGAQEKMLEKGLDIVIGTPGRLIDFSKQRKINMKDFGFLVIDEADRLFDMGFLPDLRRILKAMKPYNERHTLLFSATLNPRVGNLAWEYMNDPGEVIIEPEKVTVDTVTQELYHVGKDEKMKLLLGVLKRDDPENAVIFTNTRHSAWEVAKRLEVNGYTVEFLMGDLPQSKRLKIVDEVKKGHHKFLVATDVAARGLHIDELEMVINYDVPLEAESYVHRIGRTARAGASGKTITMACEEYVYGLGPIEKLLGQKLPVSWAEEELLVEDKSSGMRYPPRDRYKEMGSSDGRRDGRDDRRPRHDRGPRDDRRPREDSRPREVKPPREDSRPKNEKPDGPARGGKTPKSGKRPLDPRAAKIQSTVSSIAGGSLDDFEAKKDVRHEKPRADVRSDRSRPERGRSDEKKVKQSHPSRKPQGGKNVPKGHNADVERIGSDSSIDERLAYYRKKYGEDFQLTGAGGSSKSGGQKKKKRKKKPSAGKQGEAIKSNPPEKTLKKTDGAKAPETQVPETESKKPKKGLIGRLFKK
jgi:ATP-dependent RNA helicase RhlB